MDANVLIPGYELNIKTSNLIENVSFSGCHLMTMTSSIYKGFTELMTETKDKDRFVTRVSLKILQH